MARVFPTTSMRTWGTYHGYVDASAEPLIRAAMQHARVREVHLGVTRDGWAPILVTRTGRQIGRVPDVMMLAPYGA